MAFLVALIKAFAVGGLLCVLAQILIDRTGMTPARILVLFLLFGVLLGAVGLYEPLVAFAGRGATVPLCGFGYLIADGTREAIKSDGISGILTGPLSAAAGGTGAAIFFGFLASLIFRGRPK